MRLPLGAAFWDLPWDFFEEALLKGVSLWQKAGFFQPE
jgi:hypothetical protein